MAAIHLGHAELSAASRFVEILRPLQEAFEGRSEQKTLANAIFYSVISVSIFTSRQSPFPLIRELELR
jgi:hypothetical protein